nr:MAG TPA: hypothetical protein [Caudoviricetes sp.]
MVIIYQKYYLMVCFLSSHLLLCDKIEHIFG